MHELHRENKETRKAQEMGSSQGTPSKIPLPRMKFPAIVSAIKSRDSNGIKFDLSTSLSKIYFIQNVSIFADYKDHYLEPVYHR